MMKMPRWRRRVQSSSVLVPYLALSPPLWECLSLIMVMAILVVMMMIIWDDQDDYGDVDDYDDYGDDDDDDDDGLELHDG